MTTKHRYMTAYIDPTTGRESLGTGPTGSSFHRYANPKNVWRFGIKHPCFPPGQYALYSWPITGKPTFLHYLYKRV